MYQYSMKCSVSLAHSLVIQLRILLEQTLQTLAFQAACPRYIEYDYCYAEKKSFPETWFQHFPRESSKKKWWTIRKHTYICRHLSAQSWSGTLKTAWCFKVCRLDKSCCSYQKCCSHTPILPPHLSCIYKYLIIINILHLFTSRTKFPLSVRLCYIYFTKANKFEIPEPTFTHAKL